MLVGNSYASALLLQILTDNRCTQAAFDERKAGNHHPPIRHLCSVIPCSFLNFSHEFCLDYFTKPSTPTLHMKCRTACHRSWFPCSWWSGGKCVRQIFHLARSKWGWTVGKLSNSSSTFPPQNILYNIPGSTPDTGPAHTEPSGCFMASMALKPACLYGFLQQDQRSNCPQRDCKSATRQRPCSCYPRLPACSQSCTLTRRLRQQVSSSLCATWMDRARQRSFCFPTTCKQRKNRAERIMADQLIVFPRIVKLSGDCWFYLLTAL